MLKFRAWKRILALVLVMLLAVSLVACGDSKEDEDNGSGALGSATDDSVVDMGGYEFTIASPYLLDEPNLSEVTAAEAIFEEIRHKVEEDYNCKITILAIDNTVENVRTKVLAGDKIADIIDVDGVDLIPMARAGYIQPLEGVSGINLSDARWIQGYTEFTEFNGQHYGLNFMRPAEARVGMIYNRELLKSYGITEDPQELMKTKEWTFAKFQELCKATTRDIDGDGQSDTYGAYIALPETFGLSLISANDGRLVTTEDGVAKESYNNQKVLTALNLVHQLVNVDKTALFRGTEGNATSKDAIAKFVAGEYAFYYCETWQINQLLKPTCGELNYGLIALPMGPDASGYVSPSENARNFCITSTNKDVNKTVTILNALARYTEEYGEGADWWHYDLEMDYFQEGDSKSVEIYLDLLDNATLDIGAGVPELWNSFKTSVIWDACYQNKGTPASRIEAIAGKYQGAVDAVYN